MIYQKNKKKDKAIKREIITEPVRQSLLDVLEKNLIAAKRVIFVHRLIYIGEHLYPDDEISQNMKQNIIKTNQGYCTEQLSGVLLYYQRFFCHIVEGAEETLQKHLHLLFNETDNKITNTKLLVAIHHISSRFSNDWYAYCGEPPERVEEIDKQSGVEHAMHYVKNCCEKLYGFANAFITDQKRLEKKAQRKDEEAFDIDDFRVIDYDDDEPLEEAKINIKSGTIATRDVYEEFLPELKLLDFLVNCRHIKDLSDYYRSFGTISVTNDFSLKIWPLPYNYTPYNIFEPKIDPIEDLPSKEEPTTVDDNTLLLAEIIEE